MFVALQGLQKHFSAERECNYYAGLWEDSFMFDLVWCTARLTACNTINTDKFGAPSWSWASQGSVYWDGTSEDPTEHTRYEFIPEASVLFIVTGALEQDGVQDGHAVLKGTCLPAIVWKESHVLQAITLKTKRLYKKDGHNETIDGDMTFSYSKEQFTYDWNPDTDLIPAPNMDILVMLIGMERSNHKSFFLVFLRHQDEGEVYRRIGIIRTYRLAPRALFQREGIEQVLTIV
jgi:hypothetical protein